MKHKVSPGYFCIVFLALLFSAIGTHAQSETATVLGTVRDANGAAVVGANVTLKNIATSITVSTVTNQSGDYQFVNAKIGDYQIIVEATGFNRTIADRINLTVNSRQRADISLEVASADVAVTVTGAAELLETESSDKGQVIQRQQITALPLNGRSYANLALLAPGVRESHTNAAAGGGGREAAFNVNGLRATVNNFLLDGVDNNAYGTSNQSFSSQVVQVSPDAIAEFKVQTNTYSAEFGRAGGAVINATYRSGTNEFHGSAWEFHRNTVLNAGGFFRPAGGKPTLIRNQFGFTFGGPIIKDRTFFFGDYEGFRQIQKNVAFSTLPTINQRNGILVLPVPGTGPGTPNPQQYYSVRNPLTGTVYAGGDNPAQIPLADMSPFARKVLSELPLPNVPSSGTGIQSSNYSELVLNQLFSNKYNVRVDHKFNDRFNIFGRWSWRESEGFEGPNIPGPSGSNQNGFVDILNKQLTIGTTYAFENAGVFDLRFGWSKIDAGKRPPLSGGPSMFDLYGITGLPDDPEVTGGLTTQTITGFTQLGRQATNPQYQNPENINIRPSYTFNLASHSLKAGYEYLRVNTVVQDTNPLMGLDTYGGQFSKPLVLPGDPAIPNNNLYNLADFMFGARSQYEFATLAVAEMRQRFHYAYIQDDWKVNRRLTLNLGLRYEYGTPYWEKENRLSNYDPVSNSIVLASDSDRSLVDPDYNNFSPRLGFAYNIFDKTVLRGGYAKGFVFMNRLGSADILGTNYPIVTRANVPQNPGNPLCVGTVFQPNCFRPTQDGYPTDLPNNVVLYIPRDMPTASIQNWQLSVQRELFADMVLDVAYVGNKASDTVLLADLNQARPLTQAEAALPQLQWPSVDARRPIAGFKSISAVLPEGFSNYNALQIKLEKRFSKGLYLLNSFTWSKAIDNGAQVLEEAGGNEGRPQDIHDFKADKGIGAYDQPFANTTSFVYELPLGRGRWLGNDWHPAVDAVLGGWTLNGINTMRSGAPITFRYAIAPASASITANLPSFIGGIALRPNVTCDPINRDDRPDPRLGYFNAACLPAPPVWAPFGNAGRNIARGPSYFNFDLGLHKQFRLPITEHTRLDFRAEFFNLFNKTNFGSPAATVGGAGFGNITSAFPARQIQLALKVHF